MHTLSESKSILVIDQKAIVSWFVTNVAFLLGHPLLFTDLIYHLWKRRYEPFYRNRFFSGLVSTGLITAVGD